MSARWRRFSGSRGELAKVADERLTHALCEQHGNRIADLSSRRLDPTLKHEATGERLKARGLADADRSIGEWVAEPPVGDAGALRGEHGSGRVGSHPTIDVAVARGMLVGGEPQLGRPVGASAPRWRCPQAA